MPLITITQNFGSDGLVIARKVAEGLGWELFDDQKLHEWVQHQGISAREISQLDEKSPGFWDLFFRSRPQIYLNVLDRAIIIELSKEGVTTVAGVSPNSEEKKRIEAIVGCVPGVSQVVSAVEVIKSAI